MPGELIAGQKRKTPAQTQRDDHAFAKITCAKTMLSLVLLSGLLTIQIMKAMQNIRRESAGWIVRFVRNGKEYSRYFRFTNGGVRKSMLRARKWRDEQFEQLGERKWRTGPNKSRASNNTSGVIGVSKNKYNRWVASWNESGKQRFKTFKTKREAIAHRKAQTA